MVRMKSAAVFKCELDVRAKRILGTVPYSWSFAMRDLPPGPKLRVPPTVGARSSRPAATRPRASARISSSCCKKSFLPRRTQIWLVRMPLRQPGIQPFAGRRSRHRIGRRNSSGASPVKTVNRSRPALGVRRVSTLVGGLRGIFPDRSESSGPADRCAGYSAGVGPAKLPTAWTRAVQPRPR